MQAESRIEQVTLYADGACVRRVATIHLAEPVSRLRLVGLPRMLNDDSARVEASGGAVVTAVHVGLDAPPASEAADEVTPEVRAAEERMAFAESELARITSALDELTGAPVVLAPETDEPPPAWAAMVAARRQLIAVRAGREQALRDQLAAAKRAIEQARRALVAARDRDRRTGSARDPKLHELRKHVDLELAAPAGELTLHLEYQVTAARWAPSYVARIDGDRVAFELRAMIAQRTGEDWLGASVRLSTAELEGFAELPELAAQRIGRRQAEVRRTGFRPPPAGASALFMDYLATFPPPAPPPPAPEPRAREAAYHDAPAPRPVALTVAMDLGAPVMAKKPSPPGGPPELARSSPVRARASLASFGAAGVPSAPAPALQMDASSFAPSVPPPPPQPSARPPRLDYANLRMAPPTSAQRGTLIPAERDPRIHAIDSERTSAGFEIATHPLPDGFVAEWSHTYDYAYASDGTIDVRADGAWHSVAVTAKPGTVKLRHVTVPREQADVFRLAVIRNPLAGPLLPGPIDVYDRGTFLVTSRVDHTPPGVTVEIGLGVDAQVKVARNTEFREEAAGMLRGALRLHHAIKIDIDNLSEREIDLEVRERIPVTREGDDDVEVIAGKVEPAWERWSPDAQAPHEPHLRGGYRWRLAIPARQKRNLRAAYEVKIAGKHELVGGNRREA